MKKCLVLIFFVFSTLSLNAQVKLLTLNELEDRLAKGNDTTFVVNFWATWCGPCIEELPYFEKLQTENKNKPLKVMLVSLDFKKKLNSAVVPFVKKQKLTAQVYLLDEKDQQAYIERIDRNWSGALPATLFINTQNTLRLFYSEPFKTYKELTDKIGSLKH